MSPPAENKGVSPPSDNTADALHEKRRLSGPLTEEAARALLARRSRRSFLVAAAAAIAGGWGLRWLLNPEHPAAFEWMTGLNEKLGRNLFRAHALAPEFPRRLAQAPRVNGTEGLSEGFDPGAWRLQVAGLANARQFPQFVPNLTYEGPVAEALADKFPAAPVAGLLLTLDEIKALPRVEMTTELKCIEGWSTIVQWAGARVSDFVARYSPRAARDATASATTDAENLPPYVSLVTPDRGYYVGWDTPSLLHPQTLLCYEMNGEPLTLPHGGPLRLVTTAKYGIKQIKRIGRITFTHQRPADFWAEQGYDWYSGL